MKKALMRKKINKKARFSFAIALVIIAAAVVYSVATQKIEMVITQVPNIDIVLTKAKSRVDLTTFENDVKNKLQDKGVDKSQVKVTAIEAQDVNLQEKFAWQSDVSPAIGSISIQNNGQTVNMLGNPSLAGKNAIWIIPTKNEEQEFTFNYNISFGDSFNAAGMLLRVERIGNTLTGYMLSFNNGNWTGAAGGANGAIWEFTYVIGQNNTNMTKTLKKGLNISTSGNLKVKVTDSEITVSGGGLGSPVSYVIDNMHGNGYGFFSDHYSHGCDSIGQFSLNNIVLKSTTVKDFNEVLRGPEWRPEALRVVVNVMDYNNDQFSDNSALSEIMARIMNDNVYYVGWGTNTNKAQMQNIIAKNDGKGTFTDNTNYSKAVEDTAQYIANILKGVGNSNYVIAGEPVRVQIIPDEIRDNTIDAEYPNGKWKVVQDYEYFENGNGQYDKSGMYTDGVISRFDKIGKYEVTYKDEKIIPTAVYAHRRPIASFDMKLNGSQLTLNSTSYDLDKMSDNSKGLGGGISEEKWEYKKLNDSKWTTGKLTKTTTNDTYMIRLTVKDYQNTWSFDEIKYVMPNGQGQKPIASFKVVNPSISIYQELNIVDASYDPTGSQITKYAWSVAKGGTTVYTGNTPLTNFKGHGAGTYVISLVVTNANGLVSETYNQTVEIKNDTTPPEFIAAPPSGHTINTPINVSLTFDDKESGFDYYKYAVTQSKDIPTTWSQKIYRNKDVVIIDNPVDRNLYLHIIAVDKDGNESVDRVLGEYFIEPGYIVELQAIDEKTKIGIKDVEFSVTAQYEDGTSVVIGQYDPKTNKDGKISIPE